MSVISRMMGMVGGAPAANAGIDGQTFSDSRFAPTFAEAAVIFRTYGRIDKYTTLGGTTDSSLDWYLPNDTNAGSLYWICLTVVSGDTPQC